MKKTAFILSASIRMAWRCRSSYLLVFIEAVLCFAVIMSTLSAAIYAENSISVMEEQCDDELISIKYSLQKSTGELGNIALSYEDYCEVMRICGDNADVLYAVKVWLTGISNGKLVTFNLLAASDAFISRFISNNSGYAYAGNDISEIDKIVSHDEMNIAEGTFSINGAFYELNSISSSEYFAIVNTGYGTTAEAISLSESIILRLDTKTYETVLSSDTGSMQYMFIHFREGVDNNSKNMVLSSISRYFTQKSGYSYTINDYYSGYRKNISDVSQNVKLISFIASVTLLITGAGLCGTLILIVERRIKGYAVEYAMGVNKTTLNCMVFFETMTVLLLALVSALPISLLSAPLMSTGFYTVRLHTEAIVICSLGSGFIALLSALLSMHSVSSSKLAGVLRI